MATWRMLTEELLGQKVNVGLGPEMDGCVLKKVGGPYRLAAVAAYAYRLRCHLRQGGLAAVSKTPESARNRDGRRAVSAARALNGLRASAWRPRMSGWWET